MHQTGKMNASNKSVSALQDDLAFEALIRKKWKKAYHLLGTFLLFAIFSLVQTYGITHAPIPELSEMQFTEGELTHYIKGGRRTSDRLVIKLADGSSAVIEGSLEPNIEKRLKGQQIKVWSSESCFILSYFCDQDARQIQYRDELILDYEGFVRGNMESIRYGRAGYLFYLFPLFFVLMAIGVFEGASRNVKKMRREYAGEEKPVKALFGIKLLATYGAGIGLFLFVMGIGLFVKNSSDTSEMAGEIMALLGVSCFLVMYGILNLTAWGYRLAQIVWLSLLGLGIALLVSRPVTGWMFWMLIFNNVAAILILIYLAQMKVKAQIVGLEI